MSAASGIPVGRTDPSRLRVTSSICIATSGGIRATKPGAVQKSPVKLGRKTGVPPNECQSDKPGFHTTLLVHDRLLGCRSVADLPKLAPGSESTVRRSCILWHWLCRISAVAYDLSGDLRELCKQAFEIDAPIGHRPNHNIVDIGQQRPLTVCRQSIDPFLVGVGLGLVHADRRPL